MFSFKNNVGGSKTSVGVIGLTGVFVMMEIGGTVELVPDLIEELVLIVVELTPGLIEVEVVRGLIEVVVLIVVELAPGLIEVEVVLGLIEEVVLNGPIKVFAAHFLAVASLVNTNVKIGNNIVRNRIRKLLLYPSVHCSSAPRPTSVSNQ